MVEIYEIFVPLERNYREKMKLKSTKRFVTILVPNAEILPGCSILKELILRESQNGLWSHFDILFVKTKRNKNKAKFATTNFWILISFRCKNICEKKSIQRHR